MEISFKILKVFILSICEEVDMRDNAEMKEIFKKYDGWRLIYISEYTTSNKIGTSGSVCFERKND